MKFLTWERLLRCYKKAFKSRKRKKHTIMYQYKLHENLSNLYKQLENKTYSLKNFNSFVLKNTKKRYIFSPSFEDHIVQHMLYEILYPISEKVLTQITFATRLWYWPDKALDYLFSQLFERNLIDENLYVMKLDVSK